MIKLLKCCICTWSLIGKYYYSLPLISCLISHGLNAQSKIIDSIYRFYHHSLKSNKFTLDTLELPRYFGDLVLQLDWKLLLTVSYWLNNAINFSVHCDNTLLVIVSDLLHHFQTPFNLTGRLFSSWKKVKLQGINLLFDLADCILVGFELLCQTTVKLCYDLLFYLS
jgi:hypothetical protein